MTTTMRFHVLTQYRCTTIALITNLARERFILTMDDHMLRQLTVHVKGLTTHLTFEYLITCMNLRSGEWRTNKWFLFTNFSQNKYRMNRFSCKNYLFMSIQSGLSWKFLAAHVALKRFFAAMRSNMTPAIVYIRECLLTKEANICIAIGRNKIKIICWFDGHIRYGNCCCFDAVRSAARDNCCLICCGHLWIQCIIQLCCCFNHLKERRREKKTVNFQLFS